MIAELEIEAIRTAVKAGVVLPTDAFIALNASPSTAASSSLREALGGIALDRVVLEHRNMLVGGAVKDDVRLMFLEDLGDSASIADIGHAGANVGADPAVSQLSVDFE